MIMPCAVLRYISQAILPLCDGFWRRGTVPVVTGIPSGSVFDGGKIVLSVERVVKRSGPFPEPRRNG